MILPTKHIRPDRALLSVGSKILETLSQPMTVSRLWDETRAYYSQRVPSSSLGYQWFILALDLLYIIGAIDLERDLIKRA
ncbi:MAG: hypothetical protein LBS60_04095 [Deltaproteobacteria bacterium]|jgi:hypothetical protein|nr:hypothetical protein [Deltaproteobacteria bacterium]